MENWNVGIKDGMMEFWDRWGLINGIKAKKCE